MIKKTYRAFKEKLIRAGCCVASAPKWHIFAAKLLIEPEKQQSPIVERLLVEMV